ncbi:MAG: hypothetical protein HQ564_04525 [Candidatus Saganbacteria bacterium]|nr:hypothetical protein [Candidatus Saganbacteria bacterium]
MIKETKKINYSSPSLIHFQNLANYGLCVAGNSDTLVCDSGISASGGADCDNTGGAAGGNLCDTTGAAATVACTANGGEATTACSTGGND